MWPCWVWGGRGVEPARAQHLLPLTPACSSLGDRAAGLSRDCLACSSLAKLGPLHPPKYWIRSACGSEPRGRQVCRHKRGPEVIPQPPSSAGPALKGSPGTPSPGPEQPPGNLAAALVTASCSVPAPPSGDRRAALEGPVVLPPERRPGTHSSASSTLPAGRSRPPGPRGNAATPRLGAPHLGSQPCGRLAK